ncbi:hypothetical protein KBC79_05370 [Candidatus Woesebacteria bacterium]|nr:hypothetical protein [Candidatus Woesebacteria bacterium]
MSFFLPTLIAQFGNGFDTSGLPLSAGSEDSDTALTNFEKIISNFIGFMTVLAGVFFVVYFVIAAFNWITSGGDAGKLQNARDRMLHGVLGIIIVVASYAIVGLLGTIVGLDVLNPKQLILDTLQP